MKTARQQGLRGLYAGTVPALASNCSENAVLFGTYGLCQKIVANMAGIGSDTTNLNYMKNAEAGFMASVSQQKSHQNAYLSLNEVIHIKIP